MGMPKYSERNVMSKSGVNHARAVVESCNSIFHEIHQENDIGVDAIIEIIKNEHPTGKMVALQIKSGESFFVRGECVFPIKNHAKYWSSHHLPMFGIVYVPSLKNAYWVDIKKYLAKNKETSTVKYKPTKANTFDAVDFKRVFVPTILEESPDGYSFEDSVELFRSSNYDESFLGLLLLFRLYTDKKETWDEFVTYLRQRNAEELPKIFPYFLAYIPWHFDIWGGNEKINDETREYGKKLFESLEKPEIVKLLLMIDEKGIGRGTVGQSVEAVISSLPQSKLYLTEIVNDDDMKLEIRECAATIFAYKWRLASFPTLQPLAHISSAISLIVSELKQHGRIALY